MVSVASGSRKMAGSRNALCLGGPRHHPRLHKLIGDRSPGDHRPRSHAALVLVYGLGHAGQLWRVGFPSASAGSPSTIRTSKRVSEVFEVGASRRAAAAQPSNTRGVAMTAKAAQLRQPRRLRRSEARPCLGLRAVVRLRVRVPGKRSPSNLYFNATAAVELAHIRPAPPPTSAQVRRLVPCR